MKTLEEEKTAPGHQDHQPIVESLNRFATFQEARRSPEYRHYENYLQRLFNEPRIYESPQAQPRLRSFLRAVVWNIERGARLEGIVEALNHHPVLGHADLLLLKELDVGWRGSG